jgi:four helix bundle protein
VNVGGGVRHHTELIVWQEATALAVELLRWVEADGSALPWSLRDQIGRAVLSIGANIAEGFGRGSDREFARFLDIARGSCRELDSHLRIAAQLVASPEAVLAILPRLDVIDRRVARLTTHLRTGEPVEIYSAAAMSSTTDHGPRTTDLSHA